MDLVSDLDSTLDVQAIRAQLERIFASPGFVHSERLRRLLSFLVDESLAGRADTAS